MPMDHDKLIEAIKVKVLREAESRRESAAYGGRRDDGGASLLEAQVKWYEYGRQGVMPPEWKEHAREVVNENDPEWADYLRLRKKFEEGTS